jgi:hypothetical protein
MTSHADGVWDVDDRLRIGVNICPFDRACTKLHLTPVASQLWLMLQMQEVSRRRTVGFFSRAAGIPRYGRSPQLPYVPYMLGAALLGRDVLTARERPSA